MFETVALYFVLYSGHPIKHGFTYRVVSLFVCILTCESFKVAAVGYLKTSNDIILCNHCTTAISLAIEKTVTVQTAANKLTVWCYLFVSVFTLAQSYHIFVVNRIPNEHSLSTSVPLYILMCIVWILCVFFNAYH